MPVNTPTTEATPPSLANIKGSDFVMPRPLPQPDLVNPNLDNIYKMRFKTKGTVAEKLFRMKGTKEEATQRARRHCEIHGMLHIWTHPFLNDLDLEDERLQKGA